MLLRSLALGLCFLFTGAAAQAADVKLQLLQIYRIFDEAQHSAFTDLCRHDGVWYCVFREGSGHVPGTDGKIRVLRSEDGVRWESIALLALAKIDLRDPKISITPDGRLMILMGGSVYDGEESPKTRKRVSFRTHVSFSSNHGADWTQPAPVSIEKEWLWRVTWHDGVGYGFAYSWTGEPRQFRLALYRTKNGIDYEKIAEPELPQGSQPNESTIRFRKDGSMVALVRSEQKNRHAYVGTSAAPYTEWKWQETANSAGGPNFLILGDDSTMVYAGRDYPEGSRTVVGQMKLDSLVPQIILPSSGDNSYPGLVADGKTLWVSYYASHEGKTSIYIARIGIDQKKAKK